MALEAADLTFLFVLSVLGGSNGLALYK